MKLSQELDKRMDRLGIHEDDLVEKFILGTGKGGQKINKTSSCVYLKHIPTGIEVKCQQERSREFNRSLAREELCLRLERKQEKARAIQVQQIEKARRQKRRRTRAGQEKVLAAKKRRGAKKHLRGSPSDE